MNAAIVTIGDEILIGQVTDTNAVWISQHLTQIGIKVGEMVSISDTPKHIENTLDRLIGRYEIILMTGGLGPTRDDLTKETLCNYFGGKLVMDPQVLEEIEGFFRKRGRVMIESNRMQALVPDVCTRIENTRGTAPGMWFKKNNSHIISMPGVPYEMKAMMENSILAKISDELSVPALRNQTIMTHGVPESYLAEMIGDWEQNLPDCMKLAYLPRPGIVRLRITASGACPGTAESNISREVEKLNKIIPDHIFAYEDIRIEEALGRLLKEKGLSLSSAESCTGGNISRLITSIPGSSAYFKGAVVAYDNSIKTSQLGVSDKSLEKYGAVSKQVVQEMAVGVMKRFGSDTAIATSGIAGPDGGSDDKPVGTVWLAVALEGQVLCRSFVFGGHRELVIEQSSIMAFVMLRKLILGIPF